MIYIDSMTPEQAKAHLAKLQKKNRDRQREYVKKQAAEGRRRINTFISPEAGKILDAEIARTGKSVADVISDALLAIIADVDKPLVLTAAITEKKRHAKPAKTMDKSPTEKRIIELRNKGLSLQEIADKLEAEGIKTAFGLDKWSKGVIGKIIKRFKNGG